MCTPSDLTQKPICGFIAALSYRRNISNVTLLYLLLVGVTKQRGRQQPLSNSSSGAPYSSSTPVSPQKLVDNLPIFIIPQPSTHSVKFENSLRPCCRLEIASKGRQNTGESPASKLTRTWVTGKRLGVGHIREPSRDSATLGTDKFQLLTHFRQNLASSVF